MSVNVILNPGSPVIIENRHYTILGGEERPNGTEALFEEIMEGNFLKLNKHIKPQIHKLHEPQAE